jgi:predicted PurR-regulated permease PerM
MNNLRLIPRYRPAIRGQMKNSITKLKYFTYGIISFIGVIYILRTGGFILIPIVWAGFLAFALAPITLWFENIRIPRLVSVIFSMTLVTLIVLLIVYVFIIQLSSLLDDVPGISDKLNDFISGIESKLSETLGLQHLVSRDVTSYLNDRNFNNMMRFTTFTITSVTVVPVFTFLFIYYQDFFKEFIARLPIKNNAAFQDWLKEAILVVRKYVTGVLFVTLIVSVLASVMFYFLGIKYYVLFGLFTAVCNLIPYIGVILASIITLIYVLLTTDQLWYPLMTLFLLWLLQVVENNIITPVVVGARIKLNPLAVILAIITGGALWGVSGMILFIPLLGTIKIFLDKTEHLKPYSYLLGDDIPVYEAKENLFRHIRKRFRKIQTE